MDPKQNSALQMARLFAEVAADCSDSSANRTVTEVIWGKEGNLKLS